jgi:hypothetical protein
MAKQAGWRTLVASTLSPAGDMIRIFSPYGTLTQNSPWQPYGEEIIGDNQQRRIAIPHLGPASFFRLGASR